MAKILIVDDSTMMRKNIEIMLKRVGHIIVGEASTGLEAYIYYKELQPDLITMDVTMPTMNGVEAIKKIISDFPNAKIIVISALDQKGVIVDALKSGAKNYLLKPIDEEKLIKTIEDVLIG